jgi:hypothetical protein
MEAPGPIAHGRGVTELNPAPGAGYLEEVISAEDPLATRPMVLSADDVLELPLPDGVGGYEFG